jgi:proline iminopeptidase
MGAYYRRLTSEDEQMRVEAAKHWSRWEMATSRLFVDDKYLARAEADIWALQFARIEWLVPFSDILCLINRESAMT